MSRGRAFCFTWPNYPDEHQDILDRTSFRYLLYGYEWAPTTGTPHLQGYIYFANARSVAAVRRSLPGLHIELARGDYASNRTYCCKGGEYLEFGDPPQTPQEIGQAEIDRYQTAWELAKAGNPFSNPRQY